jgi:hypothetical protein
VGDEASASRCTRWEKAAGAWRNGFTVLESDLVEIVIRWAYRCKDREYVRVARAVDSADLRGRLDQAADSDSPWDGLAGGQQLAERCGRPGQALRHRRLDPLCGPARACDVQSVARRLYAAGAHTAGGTEDTTAGEGQEYSRRGTFSPNCSGARYPRERGGCPEAGRACGRHRHPRHPRRWPARPHGQPAPLGPHLPCPDCGCGNSVGCSSCRCSAVRRPTCRSSSTPAPSSYGGGPPRPRQHRWLTVVVARTPARSGNQER